MPKNARTQLGDQWRLVEGFYPQNTGTPNCILIQLRKGTEWTTVAGYRPDGTDIRACAAMYARSATAQSLTNNTQTVINYDVKVFDTDNAVTTGSSWKFTCPRGKAGLYLVNSSLHLDLVNGTIVVTFYLAVFKNGLLLSRGDRESGTVNGPLGVTCSTLVNLAESDYIQVIALQDSGASRNTFAGTDVSTVSVARLPVTLP